MKYFLNYRKWCIIKKKSKCGGDIIMVKLNVLLDDAFLQLNEFNGERYRTAELYEKLLNDITKSYVSLEDLTKKAEKFPVSEYRKKDLLKMVEYNYKYFENKEVVNSLMTQFNLNDVTLKPLAEVVC